MRILNEDEKALYEILDTRIKDVEFKYSKGKSEASFYLEPDTEVNPNDVGITYTVNFTKAMPRAVETSVGPGMKANISTLTFQNSLTGMNTLKSADYEDVNQNLVFSTIAKIVIRFFENKKDVQGITFSAAHPGLHKAYKILSLVAENKGPLKWANQTPSPSLYFIVRKEIWNNYISILQTQGD